MELSLQPQAATCFVTQQPLLDGQRVACFLVRVKTGELQRFDVSEVSAGQFSAEGVVVCRWVHVYKVRRASENPERDLKLSADALFLSLTEPGAELTAESTRLVQFLALMLERKRLLRPKGKTSDGAFSLFEHAKTKQIVQVPVGELSPEFFMQVQEQLSVLVGGPKT